ncbi:MAG: transcriptional regulator [Natronomonas sp.]|jgi:KaiC/GvpD/RAD55 family RecA-like ATPase|uniref:Transcriptional regulator n=1 Tax=Natronomonas salsuginis TaxID=2217661 RepID=A0A4U5JCV1_9EURY|nr:MULTISPECIES: transcriptional regulator [Natronomonas]MDR9380320.1 transcriptional regulator [Natronomonas sp.]MDR9430410.1 transcriptional regulator [Natronomonas sp.]TKR26445.1 transcriptional regulator [Natronomonas salsuginis]
MSERLRTGIAALDRQLEGGIPSGSIVALTAAPASQAELFLYELTAARGTLYLTLDRTSDAVANSLKNAPTRTGDATVRDVTGDAPLDNASKLVVALPESSNLVIDPVDVLERHEPARYRNFLNELQNHIYNTGGLAVLHCLDGRDVPSLRDTTEHMADVIFQLETTVKGDRVENRLAVPKFRGGRALSDVIKLDLAAAIDIDTSRDIA